MRYLVTIGKCLAGPIQRDPRVRTLCATAGVAYVAALLGLSETVVVTILTAGAAVAAGLWAKMRQGANDDPAGGPGAGAS